jgi:two-component system chemotaxis response regulator CheY
MVILPATNVSSHKRSVLGGGVSILNQDRSVLVVDDQASIRQLVRIGLRSLGYRKISEAEDGADALEQMATDCPDVVLLDGNMPRLDGVGALKAMRLDVRFMHLPVIMLTGCADSDFVRECRALGVKSFVLKPFTVEVLGTRLNSCFPTPAVDQPALRAS